MAATFNSSLPSTISADAADPSAPMTSEQAAELRRLAFAAFEPDAFKRRLTRAQAAQRIAMLRAKLKLLDEPPHVL
ncbi:MAG: DUF3072 domain-containing protein [Pseudolabrys sp.]|nr:DUF3072 domain-containing protein [Pseudolabrys sp.]